MIAPRVPRSEREQVLLDGLAAGASLIADARGAVVMLSRVVALYVVLSGEERARLRRLADELGRRLADACIRERHAMGALERTADRMVVAEHRLERARAALPALETAARGTSRAAVLAAIAKVRAALGEAR